MRISCLVTLLLASTGWGCSGAESGAPPAAGQSAGPIAASAQPPSASPPADPPAPPQTQQPQRKPPGLFEALGLGKTGPSLPDGLEIGGDCPPVGGAIDVEIAEQQRALVPLKVGLTLVELWKPTEVEEYECMTQITAVHRDAIDLSIRCNRPGADHTLLRRLCRSDLTSATMLHTAVGIATVIGETGEELPETVVGATKFSLSRRQYAALKKDGQTSHHYVQIGAQETLEWEANTTLRREGAETAEIAINGQPVKLPVIRASGETQIAHFGKVERGRVTALIVDDERFPMLADYVHTLDSSPTPRFRLYFPKITYPGADPEGELARRGKLVVHGIYFDFNSDHIRKESDPILKELGELLGRHPEWPLSINGHTDNVGGDAYNLGLSQRRAAAVVRALVDRHGLAAGRLRSAGFGASSPMEPNDTPEGRARNRRVELVRVEDPPADTPRQ